MTERHAYDTAFVRRCATDQTYSGELLSTAEFDRWLTAHDREVSARALRETAVEFDREAAEDRARHRVADVRCIRCGLRYDECQEYSCQTEGTAHHYDETELAEAARPDSETSWIGDRLRARAAAIESGATHG